MDNQLVEELRIQGKDSGPGLSIFRCAAIDWDECDEPAHWLYRTEGEEAAVLSPERQDSRSRR